MLIPLAWVVDLLRRCWDGGASQPKQVSKSRTLSKLLPFFMCLPQGHGHPQLKLPLPLPSLFLEPLSPEQFLTTLVDFLGPVAQPMAQKTCTSITKACGL
mmetsp:Transcript_13665/g.38954  ORF Transcript_13665/g.38954 Transcript_13665/m.38954 type:complete len:100 (-) Transcript_13665:632-931(-)